VDAPFPSWLQEHTTEDAFDYPVSINGKTRFKILLPLALTSEQVEHEVIRAADMQKWLGGNAPRKVIVVPGRIVNVVI
jgi:leucyl-tRNA synthetase